MSDGRYEESRPLVISVVDEDGIAKLLECPVCYELIYSPVIGCLSGHNICGMCRQSLQECPLCRKGYSGIRNLFAEQFLERCIVRCRYRSCGCNERISGQNIGYHYSVCEYRPIICRQCDEEISFGDFIEHMKIKENLDTQMTNQCSTGFEIIEADLKSKGRISVWEPTWLHCYEQDFFCFLNFDGKTWWLWVALFGSESLCEKFKCQMVLWNKDKGTEMKYVGTVHSIRTPPEDVLHGGQCLALSKSAFKNYLFKNGIDVLVGVDREYHPPLTKKGASAVSPTSMLETNDDLYLHQIMMNKEQDELRETSAVPSASHTSTLFTATDVSPNRQGFMGRPSRRCSMIID